MYLLNQKRLDKDDTGLLEIAFLDAPSNAELVSLLTPCFNCEAVLSTAGIIIIKNIYIF